MKDASKIVFLILLVLLGCTKKTGLDTNTISSVDSLPVYLSLANEDSIPPKFRQNYNLKALNIILNQKDDSINKVNLFKVANRYYNMSNWKSYLNTTKLILERSEKSRDSVNMAKAYTYLGDYYVSQSVSDSAFMNYFKAEKTYLKIKDQINLAKTFLSKANLQYNEGDFFESEINVFKTLSILKKEKNVNEILYESYNLLGVLYNEREEYKKALEFQNKALQILQDKDIASEFQYKAASLNNIGFIYMNMNEYKEAEKYFEEGLKQKNLFEQRATLYAILLDNLGYSRFKMNDSHQLPDLFYQS